MQKLNKVMRWEVMDARSGEEERQAKAKVYA
jgi:hypothetical protein